MSRTPAPIAAPGTPEWSEQRMTGIGASESSAACGLSRWEVPLDVWSRKVYRTEKEPTEAMRIGQALEPVIASLYAERTGREIVAAAPGLYRHSEIAWLLASPDGILSDESLLECKATRQADLGVEGSDEVPIEWLCQAQQQMAVLGAPAVRFAVLVSGCELREYVVERHEALIARLIDREAELWRCVETRTPPPLEFAHTRAAQAAAEAFRSVSEGVAVDLGDDALRWADEYQRLGQQIRAAEQARDEAKARLLLAIGEAEVGRLPDGTEVRRRIVPEKKIEAYVRKSYVMMSIRSPRSGERHAD